MYVRVFYGCGEDLRSNGSVGQGHKGMQASISKQASGQWDAKGKPIAESIGEPATVVRVMQWKRWAAGKSAKSFVRSSGRKEEPERADRAVGR